MFRLFALLALVSGVFGNTLPYQFDERIIGGSPANIKDHPYQCSLLFQSSLLCGCVVYSERFIITAAHCTYEQNVADLQIRYGSSSCTSGGVVAYIENYLIHDKFNLTTLEYDVSVVLSKITVEFSPTISPITLATNVPESGTDVEVTGCGCTLVLSSIFPFLCLPAQNLAKVSLKYIDEATCKANTGSNIAPTMLCARGTLKGVCYGDSGGPLVIWKDNIPQLLGLVSWGIQCGGTGVYTNVPFLHKDIVDMANKF